MMAIEDARPVLSGMRSAQAVMPGDDGERGEPPCACHVCRTLRELKAAGAPAATTIDEARRMVGG